jgi:hypothetical protein
MAKRVNVIKGGVGDNLQISQMDPMERELGMLVEIEHSEDPDTRLDIVADHLKDNKKYYTDMILKGLADEILKSPERAITIIKHYPENPHAVDLIVFLSSKLKGKKEEIADASESKGMPTLKEVNSMLAQKFPGLGLARHTDAESYYWYSDDKDLSLYLAGLHSTTVDIYSTTQMPMEKWEEYAADIMKDYKGKVSEARKNQIPFYMNADSAMRNKIIRFVGGKEMNRASAEELKEFMEGLNEDEDVGKSPSKSWLRNNSHLLKKINVGKDEYYKLTRVGMSIYSHLEKDINEASRIAQVYKNTANHIVKTYGLEFTDYYPELSVKDISATLTPQLRKKNPEEFNKRNLSYYYKLWDRMANPKQSSESLDSKEEKIKFIMSCLKHIRSTGDSPKDFWDAVGNYGDDKHSALFLSIDDEDLKKSLNYSEDSVIDKAVENIKSNDKLNHIPIMIESKIPESGEKITISEVTLGFEAAEGADFDQYDNGYCDDSNMVKIPAGEYSIEDYGYVPDKELDYAIISDGKARFLIDTEDLMKYLQVDGKDKPGKENMPYNMGDEITAKEKFSHFDKGDKFNVDSLYYDRDLEKWMVKLSDAGWYYADMFEVEKKTPQSEGNVVAEPTQPMAESVEYFRSGRKYYAVVEKLDRGVSFDYSIEKLTYVTESFTARAVRHVLATAGGKAVKKSDVPQTIKDIFEKYDKNADSIKEEFGIDFPGDMAKTIAKGLDKNNAYTESDIIAKITDKYNAQATSMNNSIINALKAQGFVIGDVSAEPKKSNEANDNAHWMVAKVNEYSRDLLGELENAGMEPGFSTKLPDGSMLMGIGIATLTAIKKSEGQWKKAVEKYAGGLGLKAEVSTASKKELANNKDLKGIVFEGRTVVVKTAWMKEPAIAVVESTTKGRASVRVVESQAVVSMPKSALKVANEADVVQAVKKASKDIKDRMKDELWDWDTMKLPTRRVTVGATRHVGEGTGEDWYFTMTGMDTEEFGPYDTEDEAEAGMQRVKDKAEKLNDGVDREYDGPYQGSKEQPESADEGKYVLTVDKDERGEYAATLRDGDKEIWSVDTEGAAQLIDDGFLNAKPHEDTGNLTDLLIHQSVIPKGSTIVNEGIFDFVADTLKSMWKGGKKEMGKQLEVLKKQRDEIMKSDDKAVAKKKDKVIAKIDAEIKKGEDKLAAADDKGAKKDTGGKKPESGKDKTFQITPKSQFYSTGLAGKYATPADMKKELDKEISAYKKEDENLKDLEKKANAEKDAAEKKKLEDAWVNRTDYHNGHYENIYKMEQEYKKFIDKEYKPFATYEGRKANASRLLKINEGKVKEIYTEVMRALQGEVEGLDPLQISEKTKLKVDVVRAMLDMMLKVGEVQNQDGYYVWIGDEPKGMKENAVKSNEGASEKSMVKDLESLNRHDTLDETDKELLVNASKMLGTLEAEEDFVTSVAALAEFDTLDATDHDLVSSVIEFLKTKE